MRKNALMAAFAVIFLAQLAILAQQIIRYEISLGGKAIVLKTRSFDPFDPVRGRYLAVNIEPYSEEDSVVCNPKQRADAEPFIIIKEAYDTEAVLIYSEKDSEGFHTVSETRRRDPSSGLFLRLKGRCFNGKLTVNYAEFSRYYIQEDLARLADRRPQMLVGAKAIIRAENGRGVLEDVVLADGRSAKNALLELQKAGEYPSSSAQILLDSEE
ncbi:MAG: GDYXXLXY domain-containing protein [Helicobacteraceae bacterium]|jgi:uncharacterized membrane-anchored protein|nr:GDYXXLXY domain-containing protein [Helicobacteraceae bacterium]